MKTRCPNCGATTSLDALLGHSDASQAFAAALNITGKLATPLVKYLGMFRSDNRDLTFERAAKLLNEIAPDITAKSISRNRQTYPAPQAAWVWAIGVMLERRDQGKLQLPLKNHGYLYEVISGYKPENAPTDASKSSTASAKTADEIDRDLRQHERSKHEKPAVAFGEMMGFQQMVQKQADRSLNGIPKEQLMAHVMQKKLPNESLEQCYQRLKAAEQNEQQTGDQP